MIEIIVIVWGVISSFIIVLGLSIHVFDNGVDDIWAWIGIAISWPVCLTIQLFKGTYRGIIKVCKSK